jgi:predicted dehydrogenase
MKTGLGFAGVGWLGESLIKELPSVPGLELAGVQDARLDVAQEIGGRYGSPWSGQDFAELLQLPNVDVVVICTPNALHVPQATAALRAGKHVLVQKPLALSYADAQATVDLARDAGRMLFVDYSYRFLATIESLRQALACNGRTSAVKAEFHNIYGPGAEKKWFFDRQVSGGGALLDLGVHLLDLALWLLQPAAVSLDQAALDANGIERCAQLRVQLDRTIPFDLAVSWNAQLPCTQISFEIDGEGGRVRWENVAGSFFRFRTLHNDVLTLERETTLRADTLRALALALESGIAPEIDTRVYALLDQAYGRPEAG